MKARIFNIQKFCLHDGPGIRSVIFLKGCPLSCRWCSNPESQSYKKEVFINHQKCNQCFNCLNEQTKDTFKVIDNHPSVSSFDPKIDYKDICPQQAIEIEGEDRDIEAIVKEVYQDIDFYQESNGGVTLSGGEPMAQPKAAFAIIDSLKTLDIHTAIETTGYVDEVNFNELLNKVDLILFDFKHHDNKKHIEGTGVSNELILKNLKSALQSNVDLIIRIPIIPNYNDSLADAKQFASTLKDLGAKQVQLLPFHQYGEGKYEKLGRKYPMAGVPALSKEDLESFRQIMLESKIDCYF